MMKSRWLRLLIIGLSIPILFGCFVMLIKAPRLRERQLVVACFNGDAAKVHGLLERGVDPNAIVRPEIDSSLKWWFHEICDPGDKNVMRMPALFAAGYSNKTAIIDDLLAHGADPNFRAADGGTALLFAAQYGNETAVRHLLEHGARTDTAWKDGTTAIDEATTPAVKKLILDAQAKPQVSAPSGGSAQLARG